MVSVDYDVRGNPTGTDLNQVTVRYDPVAGTIFGTLRGTVQHNLMGETTGTLERVFFQGTRVTVRP